GAVALHVPGAVRGGLGPAALHEAHGRALADADRAQMEEGGLLLCTDNRFYPFHAVPVLLDGGDRVPSGRGALPHLAAGERDSVLDAASHPRALQEPAPDHRILAMALEHDADRDRL